MKETNNNTETTLEDHDIVVIDLEEDPELRHRTSPTPSTTLSPAVSVGQLVADLVLEAKRNNTLPRSRTGSRWSMFRDAERISLEDKSLSATSVVDTEDKREEEREASSISISEPETVTEDEDKSENPISKSPVLETRFDLDDEPKNEDETEEAGEVVEDSSFYNGIMLETEFLVTASYSKDQFQEARETTDSLETSQLDQSGFTDLDKVNISDNEEHVESSAEEKDNESKEENNHDDDENKQDGEIENSEPEHPEEMINLNVKPAECCEVDDNDGNECLNSELEQELNVNSDEARNDLFLGTDFEIEEHVKEDLFEETRSERFDSDQEENSEEDPENTTNIMLLEEEKVLAIFSYEPEETEDQKNIIELKNTEEKAEINDYELWGCGGEAEVRGSNLDSSGEEAGDDVVDDESENEFESIAKISALDFLNDENEAEDDIEDGSDQYSRYFSSSFMFNHPSLGKEGSFPSLNNDIEKEVNQGGSYLEAINLEMDAKTDNSNWFSRFNTTDLRVNPFYKDEDSLNSQNSLHSLSLTDPKQPTFNNFQEFCDLWQMLSKEQEKESEASLSQATNNSQENTCSLLFNNLEAILEEDESEEDAEEVDMNNNYGDYDTDDGSDIIKSVTQHDNTVIRESGNMNTTTSNLTEGYKYEKMAENECANIMNSHIFNIQSDIFDECDAEESGGVQDYIGKLIHSIIENILEPKTTTDDENISILDEIDAGEEYYSCDSPDDEEASGVSTDEGIEASEDDEEDEEEFTSGKYQNFTKLSESESGVEFQRSSPTQL